MIVRKEMFSSREKNFTRTGDAKKHNKEIAAFALEKYYRYFNKRMGELTWVTH